jgi:shikimate dehydrogenase
VIKRPKRLVLIGRSLGHSLSPTFQNAALQQAGLQMRYEPVDIPASALDDVFQELCEQEAAGNVTVPHKQAVFARCDRLMAVAKRAEAVNTFWFEHGELVGDNTDVAGFDAAVRQLLQCDPRGLTIGLLGAGGAAAAALTAIESWADCRALVHNRTMDRAVALSKRFSSVAEPSDAELLATKADLVVNATTMGLRDDAFPIDPTRLRPSAMALDMVYRRGETAWVHAVRARGLRAMDGLVMLIEQGAAAFEQWLGFPPDRDAMWRSVR